MSKKDDFDSWHGVLLRSGYTPGTAEHYRGVARAAFTKGKLPGQGKRGTVDATRRAGIRAYLRWTEAGRPMFQPGSVAGETVQADLKKKAAFSAE